MRRSQLPPPDLDLYVNPSPCPPPPRHSYSSPHAEPTPFQLLVRHSRTVTVDGLRPQDDIRALVTAVEAKTRVPRDALWLAHQGKPLQPERTLASYGVAAGATVHLAVRGRGGVATFRMHGTYARSSSVRQDSTRSESSRPTAVPPPPLPPQPSPPLENELARALSTLDERLAKALVQSAEGGLVPIRLVRASWLLDQPRILRRQDLEALESQGQSPLLSPDEAVALIRKCDRSVGVLSYGFVHHLPPRTLAHKHRSSLFMPAHTRARASERACLSWMQVDECG